MRYNRIIFQLGKEDFVRGLLMGYLCRIVFSVASLSAMLTAQTTTGRLEGQVTDPSGAGVVGAIIKARNVNTGTPFEAMANERGEWVITSVPSATYRVTVTAQGFKTATAPDVKVDAGVPATVNFKLELGSVAETVEVTGTAEVLQTSTATLSSTIQGRQISELPFTSRNALELIVTQPGTQTPGTPRTSSINGLPKGSLNITIDGINVQDNLLRSDDGFFASIQPRQDAIEEVTVITAAAGAESLGEGAAQIKFVTKAGTNEFHGGAFWQHRNSYFNSNYYFNQVDGLPRDRIVFNQFGGRLGGPIKKNKAFFFFNKEEFRLPQTFRSTVTLLNDDARNGIFRYRETNGNIRTVDLYQIAGLRNPTLPGTVRQFPTTPDPIVKNSLDLMARLATPQTGTVASRIPTNNDYNRNNFTFQTPASNNRNFNTARLDYNLTDKHHLEFVWNYQSFRSVPDGVNSVVPFLPGSGTVLVGTANAGVRQIKWNGVIALRSSLSPAITSEFRAGMAGGPSIFREEITPAEFDAWKGYAIFSTSTYITNPYTNRTQSRRATPIRQFSENLTYVTGSHVYTFGGSFTQVNLWQENLGLQVTPTASLGIATNDPVNTGVTNIFDTINFPNSTVAQRNEAGALYGLLTGRVAAISRSVSLGEEDKLYGPVSAIDRNRQREFALYLQDNWRIRQGLSLNYGVRWDVQFPFQNLSGIYTTTGYEGAWGVSGVGNLFAPGVLTGTVPEYRLLQSGQGAYRTYWGNVQPSVGLAYTMPAFDGPLSWISGKGGQAVIRAGYSIATVREGMNTYVEMFGANQGRTLSLTLTPDNLPAVFGQPGSVHFRDTNIPSRPFETRPNFPLPVIPGNSVNEFDPNLRMGYVQSWNFSIQREINKDTVVDFRYVGNKGTGLWRQVNLNEVNIFENGFLNEFKVAQQNLAISRQSNPTATNFGNAGLPGQRDVPIIRTALGFISDTATANTIVRGEAGRLADDIARNATRMGRLTAAGYPANLFLVNPTVVNGGSFLMTNLGHSTYNAFQVELRRRLAGGIQAQGSYAFSKSLSNMLSSSSSVFSQPTTFRDPKLGKGPSPWDVRHGLKWNWIYELPFGPGRQYLSGGPGVVRKVLEGWQITGVTRVQSGSPFFLESDRRTFNGADVSSASADSGVILNGITRRELQELVRIRKVPVTGGQNTIVYWLPQELIRNSQAAFEVGGLGLNDLDPSKPYIGPPTYAGELGYRVFLYGPWQQHWDFSLMKRTSFGEKRDVEIRANFLNAFNAQNFLLGAAANEVNTGTIGSTFGQTRSAYRDFTVSGTNNPGGRLIEFVLRVNF
jgi:hypothetical protein